jgi:hypothetical protein
VVVGAVAWLIRTLLSDRLARQSEEFKIQLKAAADAEIERLKSSLQMRALEHEVRFSRLHDRRAKVIEEVYQRLIDAEKDYGRFVIVDGYSKGEAQQEARFKMQTKMYETSLFIEKHRIYLPAQTCVSLKAFLDVMWTNAISVGVYGSIEFPSQKTMEERDKVFREAYEALEKAIPLARSALENEFRKMLGPDPASPSNPETFLAIPASKSSTV